VQEHIQESTLTGQLVEHLFSENALRQRLACTVRGEDCGYSVATTVAITVCMD
jgi:hypothetical protein